MAVDMTPLGADATEVFQYISSAGGAFAPEEIPKPDDHYFYTAQRLLSWFPVVNSKGATYFPEDINDERLASLKGALANVKHDMGDIVGTIIDARKTDQGIDVIVQINREAAAIQGMVVGDLQQGMYYSHVSVEVAPDKLQSQYVILGDDFSVLKQIPSLVAIQSGLRRTSEADPFLYQGHRVVERIVPKRFVAVGFVPDPADITAGVYALAASKSAKDKDMSKSDAEMQPYSSFMDVDEDGSTKAPYGAHADYADPGFQSDKVKRYPLDSPAHVRAAASYFGMPKNRAKYTPEQQSHIDAAISAAKKRHGIGDEKASAEPQTPERTNSMTDTQIAAVLAERDALKEEVATLREFREVASATEAKATELAAKCETLETELASVKSERDALVAEKETAARESAIASLVSELEAIYAADTDEAKAVLKEAASAAFGDDIKVANLKLARQVEALTSQLKAKEAASAAATAAKETASTDTGAPITPQYEGEHKPADTPDNKKNPLYLM